METPWPSHGLCSPLRPVQSSQTKLLLKPLKSQIELLLLLKNVLAPLEAERLNIPWGSSYELMLPKPLHVLAGMKPGFLHHWYHVSFNQSPASEVQGFVFKLTTYCISLIGNCYCHSFIGSSGDRFGGLKSLKSRVSEFFPKT